MSTVEQRRCGGGRYARLFTNVPLLNSPPFLKSCVAVLSIAALLTACFRYQPVALSEVERGEVPPGVDLRLHFKDHQRPPLDLELYRVDLPKLSGFVSQLAESPRATTHARTLTTSSGRTTQRAASPKPRSGDPRGHLVTIDLRDVESIEVYKYSGDTTLTVIAIPLSVIAGIALFGLLFKESCPFVYVDRGHGLELVGEAYAGAAFRSIQREDLLPIPDFPTVASPRLRLSNEARETQYTDLLRLVLVDHPPDTRVLSTETADLVAVGASQPARSVTAFDGADASSSLARPDGVLWQSDLEHLADLPEPPRSDGVIAAFDAPPGDGRLVLEILGGNTFLLDATFGRFFAAMGKRLDKYLGEGNDFKSRQRLNEWRLREGVDLTLEARRDGKWQPITIVPTTGPAALRHIAVELPDWASGKHIQIRLKGGTGFWHFDQLAISRRRPAALQVHELAPAMAKTLGGKDVRAQLANVDGEYQVLATRGEAVELGFEAPPVGSGLVRSGFLRTSGYYNVHPPPKSEYRPGELMVAAKQSGGLARYALDLYRDYRRRLQSQAVP